MILRDRIGDFGRIDRVEGEMKGRTSSHECDDEQRRDVQNR